VQSLLRTLPLGLAVMEGGWAHGDEIPGKNGFSLKLLEVLECRSAQIRKARVVRLIGDVSRVDGAFWL
jgi:hypothetical protein